MLRVSSTEPGGVMHVRVSHSKKDTAVEGPQLYDSFGP